MDGWTAASTAPAAPHVDVVAEIDQVAVAAKV